MRQLITNADRATYTLLSNLMRLHINIQFQLSAKCNTLSYSALLNQKHIPWANRIKMFFFCHTKWYRYKCISNEFVSMQIAIEVCKFFSSLSQRTNVKLFIVATFFFLPWPTNQRTMQIFLFFLYRFSTFSLRTQQWRGCSIVNALKWVVQDNHISKYSGMKSILHATI